MSNKDFQNGFALGLASGGVVKAPAKEEQEKTATITENGIVEVLPDENMALSKVTVDVNVPSKEEQEKTITITENGTTEILPDENKALSKVTVVTDVVGGGETETVVEYIESTGTQYIDTGIIPINHRVKAKMQLLKKSDSAIGLFGVMGSDYSKCYGVSYYNNTWYYYAGDRHTTTNFAYSDLIEFDLNNENNEFVVNGEVIGTVNGTCSTTYSMPIFARTNTTSASIQGGSQSNARLYYFQIYDKTTNELVRDFIPAIDENGVVCLYDKITQAYFYNQGVGEFVGRFVEKAGITPLDNTVTFTVEGAPYEIVSVRNGNRVNSPATEPTKEGLYFSMWGDSEGNKIIFPYTPESDIEIKAVLSTTREEITCTKANEVMFGGSANGTDYSVVKANDGVAICGYVIYSGKYCPVFVGKTAEAIQATNLVIQPYKKEFDGVTYYYAMGHYVNADVHIKNAWYIGSDGYVNASGPTANENAVKRLINYYNRVIDN